MTLAALLLAAVLADGSVDGAMRQHDGPMAKVLEDAKAQGRPILVDFFTTWCGPCKWMDKEVFGHATVAEFANANYVVYKIDAEKGEGPELAKKYAVEGYPTFVLLDSAGEEVDRQVGSSPREDFLGYMKAVHAGDHLKSLRAKAEKDPEDGAVRGRLGVRLARMRDDGARPHLEKAASKDPEAKQPGTVEVRFYIALLDAQAMQSPDPLEAFGGKHPDSAQAVDAHRILWSVHAQLGNEEKRVRSLEIVVQRAPDAASRNDLAWTLALAGKELDRAMTLIDAALKDAPEVAAFIDTKAEVLSKLGRHDEAIALQKKAIAALAENTGEEERAQYEDHLRDIEKRKADAPPPPTPGK